MRRIGKIALVLTLVAGFHQTKLVAQGRKDQRIAKPAPIVAAVPFQLKVETKPRFPNANRPEASTPVESESLSVTIQPEKTEFAGNGPLAFAVTFRNKSKTPMMLFGAEHLGVSPKLVVSNLENANQWSITGKIDQRKAAVQLGAGESKTYTLVIEGNPVVVPQPFPMPRPIPFPVPARKNAEAVAPPNVVPPKIIRPRPPVVIGQTLPCGQGKCRARLLLEFKTDPIARYKHPTWTGKIATATVDFQVGKPNPVVIVAPVIGGPLTKEQAIQVAKSAAERALTANYRPVPGVKPAHNGSWIENAEKTATVTKINGGGWTIAWTHFPKSGFSYNVKIAVNANGSPVIKEVFTSYSE